MAAENDEIPEEFKKVVCDFVPDILRTFPEYEPLISKWWKPISKFQGVEPEEERLAQYNKSKENSVSFLYKFCSKKYPPRFFEILNQDVTIFNDDSEADTEFLPFIHFKNLWQDEISSDTRETLWKYLQLILFSVVNSVKNKDAFGDTAKLFEEMNEDDFKQKLDGALDDIKGIFENKQSVDGEESSIPTHNVDEIHSHLSGMFSGKLGNLAREIAEETAGEINMETDGSTDIKDVFNNMFKNPGKLMGLVQNVGSKLEDKIKSGEMSEAELMKEASEMMTKMKGMPGMGDIQSMMGKLGMNTGGAKMDVKGMEHRMRQEMKKAETREKMMKQGELKRKEREAAEARQASIQHTPPKYTDDELVQILGESVTDTEPSKKSKSKNKKKKKNVK